MSELTLKELAIKILEEYNNPMNSEEIWSYALSKNYNSLVNCNGKTPWQTIGAQIYVDMKENGNSRFVKVGKHPTRFFIKKKL